MTSTDPRSILGFSISDPVVRIFLSGLANKTSSKQSGNPEIKGYSDAVYVNFYPLGISFMLTARDGSKSLREIDAYSDQLVIDSMDIYNTPPDQSSDKTKTTATTSQYTPYPESTIELPLIASKDDGENPTTTFRITNTTTGKDFVSALGEPERKGGGAGPSNGSIGIWCEWKSQGVMVRSVHDTKGSV